MPSLSWKIAGSLVALALALSAGPANAEVDAKTVRTWKAKCASCHGADGKGDTDQGKKLGVVDLTKTKPGDAEAKRALLEGKTAQGKAEGMESFKDKLSDEQIDALVAYVRELK